MDSGPASPSDVVDAPEVELEAEIEEHDGAEAGVQEEETLPVEPQVETASADDEAAASTSAPVENITTDEVDQPPVSASVPDARDLFGSDDDSDGEEDAAKNAADIPTDADETPADVDQTPADVNTPGNAQPDEDNLSEGGSIKSDRGEEKLSDFDIMMQQKSDQRKQAYRRRKRQDVDLINDHDDKIKVLIDEMKEAAEADRRANQRGECAISKLTMLARIMNLLRKHDLQTAMLDLGILSALADWLAPLPDGNLPHLKIRESILKVLQEMSSVTPEQLKNSGIGKAVMLLFKHPREMKENRVAAGKLIQEWSRPIFGTSANYRSLSREDREERDLELLQIKKRQSLDSRAASGSKKRKDAGSDEEKEEEKAEDDNSEIPRARVPQPSMKDYVIRPKSAISNMEPNEGRRSTGTKPQNRFVKKMRGLQEQQRAASASKNKHLSLEGRKML